MEIYKKSSDKKKLTLAFSGDERKPGPINSPTLHQAFDVNLKQKNGRIHALTVVAFGGRSLLDIAVAEGELLETILDNMQEDNYEIVDIKHSILTDIGAYSYKTIIIYR